VKFTPGVMAIVTGIGFLALTGAGVTYVANAPDQVAAKSDATPTDGPKGSPSSPASSASTGYQLTMSAAPSASSKPRPKPAPSPKPKPKPSATVEPPPELDFTLTSFNVLGASHTGRGGNHKGYAGAKRRNGGMAALLRKHRADVVGFQELQGSQLAYLGRHTNFDFYPGFSRGHLGTDNSIGWRRDSWTAVEKRVIRIPYFNGGAREMPVVRLRNISTGIEAWFANFHNPAETARFHRQGRFRVRATHVEAALANRLIATGLPVFFTGDMNERAAYFCRLTARAPMIAARGGTNNGGCRPGRPRAVDWILGSQGVQFTSYVEDRSRLVHFTTDHPVITAGVHLIGKPGT
jgi:Endonuclease/Exonuclease/phosphatase family